ncbi:MAG: DUF885 domain-containing protein [Pyrinomonadaceae bacterium]|nr:DUF885 domain-containing protein [Pyrinomonadaceae bacterium]
MLESSHRLCVVALVLVLAAALTLQGCQQSAQQTALQQPQQASPTDNAKRWDAFVDDFINSYFAAHPDIAVYAGRHEFDGKLPDWSQEGIAREIQRLRSVREQAMNFGDASLDERQRFERDYLVSRIDADLFWLGAAEWHHRNPYFYADALDPDVYISREYAPLPDRMRAYVKYAQAVPLAITQVRNNLRLPLPRTYIKIGRTTLAGLASTYEKDVPAVFASVQDQQLQIAFRQANEAAAKAMKEFDLWLKSQEATATDDFALGADKFSQMLRSTERVDVPLDKLEETGRQDMERNLASLREACARYAPNQTIQQCVAKQQANKPEGGVVEGARAQLKDIKQFLTDKNLVTIPGTEEALVDEAPPYKRWNFAYINIPGPYEKNLPSVYYISPPDPSWSETKRNDYVPGKADLLFTSVHEVWPGHFLQFLHANRAPSKFGQVFVGYAFAEGWAHYAEEMMWDAGLGDSDPETHIGQLLNALLRNVRFLSAIGMHARGMSVADSERMFREAGMQDAGNAQQQAERGTFDPAYLNYTMGKLMIRKLREDWTATRGGREAWKEFHDQFLRYGGPPIPLVRGAMLSSDGASLF